MAKKSTTKTAPKRYVPRQTRKFQLRTDNLQDLHVQQVLDFAKSQRREVTLIRDAITLYYALENGDLNALFDKFPAFRASFILPTTQTASGAGPLEEIKSMLEMITSQQQSNSYHIKPTVGSQSILPPPVAEVKSAAPLSADAIADNFLSMFQ